MSNTKKMYYAECKTAYGIKLWKSESKVCRDNFVKHSMGFAKAISQKQAMRTFGLGS